MRSLFRKPGVKKEDDSDDEQMEEKSKVKEDDGDSDDSEDDPKKKDKDDVEDNVRKVRYNLENLVYLPRFRFICFLSFSHPECKPIVLFLSFTVYVSQ